MIWNVERAADITVPTRSVWCQSRRLLLPGFIEPNEGLQPDSDRCRPTQDTAVKRYGEFQQSKVLRTRKPLLLLHHLAQFVTIR